MTQNGNGEMDFSAQNNKKAYFAMCRAVVLLFVFMVLSELVGRLVGYLLTEYGLYVQKAFTHLFMLFGSDKQLAISISKQFLQSTAFSEFVKMISSFLTMVIPAIIFARSTNITGDECFCVGGKTAKGLFFVFCACQLFTMTASVISQTVYGFLVPGGDVSGAVTAASGINDGVDVFGLVVRIINACIFVPIAEEFVFRGVLFSYLRRYGLSFGVISSAVLFGIAHSSPTQSVYAFVFGLIAAFLAAVTGNIKTGIMLHALNNFVTVISAYLPSLIGETVCSIFYGIYLTVVIMFSFYGIYRLAAVDNMFSKFKEKAEENDACLMLKPGIAQIVTVPLVIYAVYYAGGILIGVLMK